jgi:peroxiredoxin Q/BCP
VLRDSHDDIEKIGVVLDTDSPDEMKPQKAGTIMLGVSVDDIETQKRFKEKLGLPFELLSDSDREVSKAFGVLGFMGKAQRKTFIIDPDGKIAYVFNKVKVRKHDEEVKEILEKLQSNP